MNFFGAFRKEETEREHGDGGCIGKTLAWQACTRLHPNDSCPTPSVVYAGQWLCESAKRSAVATEDLKKNGSERESAV